VVETLNIIDKGTSVLVAHHVRDDFTAETASSGGRTNVRRAGITFLHYAGPGHTLGGLSAISSDFPAALVRFCHSSGVAVLICDPHHPNKMALSNDQPTLPSFRFWTAEFNPHPVIQSRSFRSIPYAVSRPLLSCSFLGEIVHTYSSAWDINLLLARDG
jgi:hypothetical protein